LEINWSTKNSRESKENIIINKKLTDTSNELKKISDQLKKRQWELIKKDLKDEFLDTVTHELREPYRFVQQPKSCMMTTTTFRSQKTVSTKHYFRIGSFKSFNDKILDLENLKQENRELSKKKYFQNYN
jgi:hypothetical protein